MIWYGIDLGWAYSKLLPVISQQTRCVQYSHDILHDALIRFALVKRPEQIEHPHAYLTRVVRSVLVDDHRINSRFIPLISHPSESTDEDNTEGYYLLEDTHTPSTEHMADLNQRLQALQIIIDALPKKCREVFWLYGVEGYTQPEIAGQIGISLNMVERHVMRALISLRAECDQILQ